MQNNINVDFSGLNFSCDLQKVICSLLSACVEIQDEIPRQAAKSAIRYTESTNIHGEQQNSIDILSNHILANALKANAHVMAYGSEEEDDCVPTNADGKYLVTFDPLDGSTNIEVGGTTATIFSVLPAMDSKNDDIASQFMQPGINQLCAGYALYSSSLTVVLTNGSQVYCYVWLPSEQKFVNTCSQLKTPGDSKDISGNLVSYKDWPEFLVKFVEQQVLPKNNSYRQRYQATIASDLHRIFKKGGLYLYPQNEPRYPNGKIRLIYEASPLALIAEATGAKALTDTQRILEIVPNGLHQTVPVIYGSSNEVKKFMDI